MLQRAETQHLDAVRDAETLRGELKAALADREWLQQKWAIRAAALPDQPPTAESDRH
jgi:hypothetical protein